MFLRDAITLVFHELGGLREKLETARGYERDARHFCMSVHNPLLEAIKLEHVIRFLKDLEEAGFARNGVQMKACALKKLFTTLKMHGHFVSFNPEDIPLPRKEFRAPRVATREQISKVLDVISNSPQRHLRLRNKAMLLLLRDTGMRAGELRALDVNDIDLVKREALIKTEKSRGMVPMRPVVWFKECNEVLREWMEEREKFLQMRGAKKEAALFVVSHRDSGVTRIGPSAVHIMLRKASWAAGVKTLNAHSLRHMKGRDLAQASANNSMISRALGHSSLASSFIYSQMNDEELKKELRKHGE